jgi:hypothetical protein
MTYTPKTILVLAANPINQVRLRLDEEVREIDEGLRRSKRRDCFKLVQKWAVGTNALRRALLDFEPQIVHFCGHGVDDAGLVLEDETGQVKVVTSEALAKLFELCKEHIECVVLNACYSEKQANAIAQHVGYVIGMNEAIGDKAAIKFAVGFYDALGAGRSVEDAHEFGCNAIQLEENTPQYLVPILKKNPEAASTFIKNLSLKQLDLSISKFESEKVGYTISTSLLILILICFFLPFVTLSCGRNSFVQASGIEIALGTKASTVQNFFNVSNLSSTSSTSYRTEYNNESDNKHDDLSILRQVNLLTSFPNLFTFAFCFAVVGLIISFVKPSISSGFLLIAGTFGVALLLIAYKTAYELLATPTGAFLFATKVQFTISFWITVFAFIVISILSFWAFFYELKKKTSD